MALYAVPFYLPLVLLRETLSLLNTAIKYGDVYINDHLFRRTNYYKHSGDIVLQEM